jgi:hypothetical protein
MPRPLIVGISRAIASKTSLDTRTYVLYNTLSLVAQPQRHLRRGSRRFVVYRRGSCCFQQLAAISRDSIPCRVLAIGELSAPLRIQIKCLFRLPTALWRPGARSQPPRPRHISKNIRSYWIWQATSKIVAYATKYTVPSAEIKLRRTAASQIVVYATKCVTSGWLHRPHLSITLMRLPSGDTQSLGRRSCVIIQPG